MVATIKILLLLSSFFVVNVSFPQNPCTNYFDYVCKADKADFSKLHNTEDFKQLRDYYETDLYMSEYILGQDCPQLSNIKLVRHVMNKLTSAVNVTHIEAMKTRSETHRDRCLLKLTLQSDVDHINEFVTVLNGIFDEAKARAKSGGELGRDFDFNAKPQTNEEVRHYLRKLFTINHAAAVIEQSPIYKSKLLYKQCLSKGAAGDAQGLLAVAKEIGEKLKTARTSFAKKNDPIKCGQGQNSEGCKEFSAALAALHEHSAAPLFAIRPLDLLSTSINSNKRVGAITPPPFVGDYDTKFRFEGCFIESQRDIDFFGTAFDNVARSKDREALKRFELLSQLVGLDRTTEELIEIVSFEKKLFKFAPANEVIDTPETADKVASFIARDKLEAEFGHVVDWASYFERLLREMGDTASSAGGRKGGATLSDGDRAIKNLGGLVLFCKAYFFGLNEAMKHTPAQTVLDYVRMATFYHVAREYPAILNENDRGTLGLALRKNCYEMTTSLFPQITSQMRWRHSEMSQKPEIVDGLIKRLETDFEAMIGDSSWLSDQAKAHALNKASSGARVFGVRPEKTHKADFAALFRFAAPRPSFAETLAAVLRNNHIVAMRTLFEANAESAMRTVRTDAHAGRSVRDNRLIVDPALVLPPFIREGLEVRDVYAHFGFVIGREMTRVVALKDLHYGLSAIYGQTPDEKTKEKLHHILTKLKKEEALLCAPKNSLFSFFGKSAESEFESVSDELIDDLGGFTLALSGFKELVGERKYEDSAPEFLHKVAELFCVHSSLDMAKNTKTTNECRLALFSRTKDFIAIFPCDAHQNEEINFW